MPHKQLFLDFLSHNSSRLGLAMLTALAVVGRVFYTGARWREMVGDLIICPLVTLVLAPAFPADMHITVLKITIPISPEFIAVAIGIAGMHGLRYAATRRKNPELKENEKNG